MNVALATFLVSAAVLLRVEAHHGLFSVSVDPKTLPSAGVKHQLTLHLTDEAGAGIPLQDLNSVHEKLLHVMVLSSHWDAFVHVHPEDFEDLQNPEDGALGKYHIALEFPTPGEYVVMVEFAVRGSDGAIQIIDVETAVSVLGAPKGKKQKRPSEPQLSVATAGIDSSQPLQAVLPLGDGGGEFVVDVVPNDGNPLFVGVCAKLEFSFKLEGGGEVTDLVPYLGAASHIAVAHESMAVETLMHLHGMSSAGHGGEQHEGMMHEGMHAGGSDPCAMDMLDMPPPPARLGSKVVAYHQFTRPGIHVLVAQVQREGGDLINARFLLRVLELPVVLYTNPDGPLQAGQQVELEARLAADSFWGANPSAALEAILVSADLQNVSRVSLGVPPGSDPSQGFRGNATLAAAGLYHVLIRGVLQTDVQQIPAAKNFTLQVEGSPAMESAVRPWELSQLAKLFSTRQAMVSVFHNGTHEPMSTAEMNSFQATSDGVKVSLEVNGGGIATAKHCIALRIRTAASRSNLHALSVSDGDAGHIVAVRRNPSGGLDNLQYAALYLVGGPRGTIGVEGYGPDRQKELLRGLCSPSAQSFRATEVNGAKVGVAFMTFQDPGEYLLSVSVKTPTGMLKEVNFVINVCPETAVPLPWSSPCAWVSPPAKDDRVLIPGGKHIILDQTTPMLGELVIQGTLEVAPGGNPKVLNTARILLDGGGSLLAGNSSVPYQGDFTINLDRGGLAVLGTGALKGSGILAVADGTLSLVGSKGDGQDGQAPTLSASAAAGANVVFVDLKGITWQKGQRLLIASASNSSTPAAVSEVVTFEAYKANTGKLSLASPLLHSYPSGSMVARMSRSIRITSEQYKDGGSRIRLVPSSGKNTTIDGGAIAAAMMSRRKLLWGDERGADVSFLDETLQPSTRRLLHSDITASLSKAGEVLVAAGGDGTTYFVSNRSMDVTLEAVEIEGMGRAGSRNPLLELALPDDFCLPDGNPLHRPPSLKIRQTVMHSLHAACLHISGVAGTVDVSDNVCYRARGEGFLFQGLNASCSLSASATLSVKDNMILETVQGQAMADIVMGLQRPVSGIWVEDLAFSEDGAAAPVSANLDSNIIAGSEGHGIAIVRSQVSNLSGNAALHNRLTGLLYSDKAYCGILSDIGDSFQPLLNVYNTTLAGNGESQACVKVEKRGMLQTEDVHQKMLQLTPASAPEVQTLDAGVWLENESIPEAAKAHLRYYRFDVPEDSVSVKLSVNQLKGFVDVLVNPYGGAPCHSKFEGCPPQTPPSNEYRNNIRGMSNGFSAKQDSSEPMITIPMPNLKAGTWVIAVGCQGCTFNLGINFTLCGDGWMGFKSNEPNPSPYMTETETLDALVERAGYNFTCVPVIPAQVNTPVLNLTLHGNTGSAFIKTEIPEFTSQLWTRVRRVGHIGKRSALHFRTYSGRLPTFAPSTHTSAQTLTSAVDVTTPAPDVREAYEVEDDEVSVDHFSMMQMFLNPGTYYTVVTQSVKKEDPMNKTVVEVEVEVGAQSCETGRQVQAENYFFPPHHIEDMVSQSKDGHIKRACNMAVELVQGLNYLGPQAVSTRYNALAGMTRGGRTTEYLIDVPKYSRRLNIHLTLSNPENFKRNSGAEIYVRQGVPPVIVDQEDYVQWQYDKYYRMQASLVIEVPWSELYERWGYWYVVIAWTSMNEAGTVEIDIDTGGMPLCPGASPCSDHGRCWSVDGRGLCACDTGWEGEDCRFPMKGFQHADSSPGIDSVDSALEPSNSPAEGSNIQEAPEADTAGGSAATQELEARIRELENALDGSKSAVVELTSQLEDAEKRAAAVAEDTPLIKNPPPPPPPPQKDAHAPKPTDTQGCNEAVAAECACVDEKAAAANCLARQAELTDQLNVYNKYGSPADLQKAAQELEDQHAQIVNLTAYSKELEQGICNGTLAPISRLDGIDGADGGNPIVAILIGILSVAAIFFLIWYLRRGSSSTSYVQLRTTNGNGMDRQSEMVEAGENWSITSSSKPFSTSQHRRVV